MTVKNEEEIVKERLAYLIREMNKMLYREYGIVLKIPVNVNPRLRTTNGWVKYERDRIGGKIKLNTMVMEFNKTNLLKRSMEYVLGTALHEAVHYACIVKGKPHRDGDYYFENELKRLGIPSNNTTRRSAERKQEDIASAKEIYKDQMFYYAACSKCEKRVKTWKKKPSIQNIEKLRRYRSSCCHAGIHYAGGIPAEKVLNPNYRKTIYMAYCTGCRKTVKTWDKEPSKQVIGELRQVHSKCCNESVAYGGSIELES